MKGAKFGVTMLHMLKHFREDASLRGRGYALVVVSLTTFVIGLVLWPSPFHGHLATIVVSTRTANGEPMPTSNASGSLLAATERELMKQLGEREFLAAAFGMSGDTAAESLGDTVVQAVRRGLGVKHLTHAADEARVSITVLRDSENQAMRTAELLADELIRRRSHSERQSQVLADHRRKQWAMVEARHYEKRARQTLDNFVQEHLQRAQRQAQGLFNTQPVFDAATADVAAATVTGSGEANPRWVQLSQELQELYDERDELLRRLTVNHPRVQDVSVEVARKEQDLADLPRYLGATRQTSALTDADSSYSVKQVNQILEQFGSAMAEEYEELHRQFDQAAQKREACEREMDATTCQLSALTSPTFRWQVETEKVVEPLGSRPTVGLVGMLLLVSMVSGVGFVYWRECVASPIFRSSREVQQTLGVPIVAEVSGQQVMGTGRLTSWHERGPRVALAVCELILASFAVILILAAVLGSSLWWDLTSDPLGTLTHLFRHLI